MEEIISEGLTIRRSGDADACERASVNDVEEIIGDGCFFHMHFVSDQQIDMVLADSANTNQYSFSIRPKFDEDKCRIFLSCDGSIDKYDHLIREIGKDVIEENKSLKKRIEYLEKSIKGIDIELRLERATKTLKINELIDKINALEKHKIVNN
jgi:hypothetical protein